MKIENNLVWKNPTFYEALGREQFPFVTVQVIVKLSARVRSAGSLSDWESYVFTDLLRLGELVWMFAGNSWLQSIRLLFYPLRRRQIDKKQSVTSELVRSICLILNI